VPYPYGRCGDHGRGRRGVTIRGGSLARIPALQGTVPYVAGTGRDHPRTTAPPDRPRTPERPSRGPCTHSPPNRSGTRRRSTRGQRRDDRSCSRRARPWGRFRRIHSCSPTVGAGLPETPGSPRFSRYQRSARVGRPAPEQRNAADQQPECADHDADDPAAPTCIGSGTTGTCPRRCSTGCSLHQTRYQRVRRPREATFGRSSAGQSGW